MIGLLPFDKPAGMTSRRLLNILQRQSGQRRIGHAGTLDPFATGILLVLFGSATRLNDHLHAMDKTYEATLRLGVQTDTLDPEGDVVAEASVPALDEETLGSALEGFVGTYEHVPPAFSAIHIGGRRLYDLARAGRIPAEIPRRATRIHSVRLLAWEPPDLVRFEASVSSGTYIRSLGRDLAERLGTVGSLTALRRTKVGPFRAGDALPLSSDDPLDFGQGLAIFAGNCAMNALGALYPVVLLDAEECLAVRCGRTVPIASNRIDGTRESPYFVLADQERRLVALGRPKDGHESGGLDVAPHTVMSAGDPGPHGQQER